MSAHSSTASMISNGQAHTNRSRSVHSDDSDGLDRWFDTDFLRVEDSVHSPSGSMWSLYVDTRRGVLLRPAQGATALAATRSVRRVCNVAGPRHRCHSVLAGEGEKGRERERGRAEHVAGRQRLGPFEPTTIGASGPWGGAGGRGAANCPT